MKHTALESSASIKDCLKASSVPKKLMKPNAKIGKPIWLPQKLRVSLGTAIALGLADGKLQALPTTAYLMTYRAGRCNANCGFCSQARESQSSPSMLSRVSWPAFQTEEALEAINKNLSKKGIRRICVQALNYPGVFKHLTSVVAQIRSMSNVSVSVSCQPSKTRDLQQLVEAGVERVGIPLDAATESIFDRIKGRQAGGPYCWKKQFHMLKEALRIFGEGNVTTHLIVGLGETEKEMVKIIQECVDIGVLPALFAFTPVRGTRMQNVTPPPIREYRRIQIARFLVLSRASRFEKMHFAEGHITDFGVTENLLRRIVSDGEAFRTSGCPDCNRPYYNERPTGPMYNYPRKPKLEEISEIEEQIGLD